MLVVCFFISARAGTTTALASGEITVLECDLDPNLDQMAWYCGNSGNHTHPVAQKLPNMWQLYDMHGNVWEWVWDWLREYKDEAVTDPLGAEGGTLVGDRGGAWSSHAHMCRSANRDDGTPDYHANHVGFRLVRSLPGAGEGARGR